MRLNLIIGLMISLLLVSPSPGQTVEEYFSSGYQEYINGQYDKALEYYNLALSSSPESSDAYYWKAKCYDKLQETDIAVSNLKATLELNPDHWGAKYLLRSLTKGSPENYPSRGNVSFAFQDTDIRQAIYMLARETGLNLVPSHSLRGTITLSLTNISTSEALKAIIEAAQVKIVQEGMLLKIFPLADQPEVFEIGDGVVAKTYKIDYIDTANLVEILPKLLPEAEKIETVKGSNQVVIQGQREIIKRADALIRSLDAPPKQVVVEAKVIELRASEGSSLGLDIKGTSARDQNDVVQTKGFAGRASDVNAQGIYAQVLSSNLEAYLSSLSTKTGYNLVASPRITTLSGKPASILIGAKYGYKTAIITQTSTTQQVQFLEVGTSLTFTPWVTKDGFIKMQVAPKVSEGQVVNDLPQENTTETVNEVMVRDGQTIVIGGLIKNKEIQTDAGVPFIMNIPFLGAMFRKTIISTEKTELLVFVTPHILTPERLTDMEKESTRIETKSESQKAELVH